MRVQKEYLKASSGDDRDAKHGKEAAKKFLKDHHTPYFGYSFWSSSSLSDDKELQASMTFSKKSVTHQRDRPLPPTFVRGLKQKNLECLELMLN